LYKRILIVFGTRPEAIKMIPIAKALAQEEQLSVSVCVTAQHRDMLDQVLALFDLTPDHDLNIMSHAQTLSQITIAVQRDLEQVFAEERPDLVLVHGDTTTSMAAALAAFQAGIAVGHVEAGLRSGDKRQPWPEEMNRRIVGSIADLHFAPTRGSRENLLRENVSPSSVLVTGNTVIDALLDATTIISRTELANSLRQQFRNVDFSKRLVLMTAHRRENFGKPLEDICDAILELVGTEDINIVLPVHPNPRIRNTIEQRLSGVHHLHLTNPLDYVQFVYLMQQCHLIITDSGGVQEEGPFLGKPVFVLRNVTERPEAIEAGGVKLVGTERSEILSSVKLVLNDSTAYEQMSKSRSPYGDGKASQRIVDYLTGRSVQEFQS
jgi:UDP-N-acetylglucosamine 2-epimerase